MIYKFTSFPSIFSKKRKRNGFPSNLVKKGEIFMDFRDQSSSVFSSSTSGGVDRRRENGASTVIFSPPSLVFDHHPHHLHRHHQKHHPSSSPPSPKKQSCQEKQSKVTRDLDSDPKSESESEPDQDPDPVSVSIAVAGPISVKSNPRTPSISKSSGSVRYRECLKNHAASTGGHVVDGCGEFMPSGEEGSLGALKCAACNCHRNFHRKEVDDKPKCRGIISPLAQPLQFQKISLGSPGPTPFQPTTMMAFGSGGGATESSSEDINLFNTNPEGSAARQMMMNSFGQSKKRFRTKFTQEQKEKMLEFADKIGWRFQKQDEADIQVFCSEVGIQREVLKVWMHNNKHSMKMKQQQQLQQQLQQQQE